jgi:hypothetical protein
VRRSTWPGQQQRLRPVQGLDLRFFIHAQNQSPVRRIQVQADNIADLFHE